MQKMLMISVNEFALLIERIKQQSASIIDLVLNVFGGKVHSDGKLWVCSNCESLIIIIIIIMQLLTRHMSVITRKLCYRKDDRAMRPIHGCPENFRDSLTTLMAIISNIFHGLLFGSTLWMFIHNLKSLALSVPEIIEGTQKIWAVPGYAHALFSPKILMDFYSDWPCKCTRQIWSP